MSSLLKADTYYSSYGDPGKIYPYPSILSLTVKLPASSFVYTDIAGVDADLEILDTQVFTGLISSNPADLVSSTANNLSAPLPYIGNVASETQVNTSLSPASNYIFRYGDFNNGNPEGEVQNTNLVIVISGD